MERETQMIKISSDLATEIESMCPSEKLGIFTEFGAGFGDSVEFVLYYPEDEDGVYLAHISEFNVSGFLVQLKPKSIYKTPNGIWEIREDSNPEWQSVFGKESIYYNVYNVKNKYLCYSEIKLKDVFEWMVRQNIISKDEMKYKIEMRNL